MAKLDKGVREKPSWVNSPVLPIGVLHVANPRHLPGVRFWAQSKWRAVPGGVCQGNGQTSKAKSGFGCAIYPKPGAKVSAKTQLQRRSDLPRTDMSLPSCRRGVRSRKPPMEFMFRSIWHSDAAFNVEGDLKREEGHHRASENHPEGMSHSLCRQNAPLSDPDEAEANFTTKLMTTNLFEKPWW